MDKPLRAPRNRTAEMQLILRLVSEGYTYWTEDQIPLGKLPDFLMKWSDYRLLADTPARSYRKRRGRANSFLILEHRYRSLDSVRDAKTPVHWLMVSTKGKDGLGDEGAHPGKVRQINATQATLGWMGYELVRQRKHFKEADGRLRSEVTWTWRLPGARYREWEALLINAARQRNEQLIQTTFEILKSLPLFAGIRTQVIRLHQETNRMLKKVGATQMPDLQLPYMTLIPIWDEKPQLAKVRKSASAKPALRKGSGKGRFEKVGRARKPESHANSAKSGKSATRESGTKNFRKLAIVRQAEKALRDILGLRGRSPANAPGESKLVGRLVGWIRGWSGIGAKSTHQGSDFG